MNKVEDDLAFLVANLSSPPSAQRQLRATLVVALQDLGHPFEKAIEEVDKYLDQLEMKVN